MNSKIINGNEQYNKSLKNWINPSKRIKAEFLYRLTENGDKFSTFHELCDNKGPTLTLFHVNDGNKVGIYTPLSWESTKQDKKDMDTFIFNLNKNKKYKKLKSDNSLICRGCFGPDTARLGCEKNSMKLLGIYAGINEYYDKGSEILPSNNKDKTFDILEVEVYKIIIQ